MKIITTPNPILTQPAQPVEKIDKHTLKIIEEMKKILTSTQNPKGVGLAAPQMGFSLRIFITKPFDKSEIKVFVNPQFIDKSKEETGGVPERENKLEGCLSIPKIWGTVKRHEWVVLKYQDEIGKTHQQKFTGFLATIIQHEMDHLDGKLFPSRTLKQKGKLYQNAKDKEGKEILEELELT